MRALVVRQPWATLIALGHKTIETRPSPPNGPMRPKGVRGLPGCSLERGERIAIVAGATPPTCSLWEDAPYDDIGDRWQYGQHAEGDKSWWLANLDPTRSCDDLIPLPLGAVVCAVTVDDALPIVDWTDFSDDCLLATDGDDLLASVLGQPMRTLADQLPLGDFSPGRWGWLLSDPQPITKPCLNIRHAPSCSHLVGECPDCGGTGRIPIPCKGRQGVFELPVDIAEAVQS